MPHDIAGLVDTERGLLGRHIFIEPEIYRQELERVFAHLGGEEITGLRDLAVVAQKEPAAGEDPLQFLLINIGLNEDAAADETIFVIDQSVHVVHCRLQSAAPRPAERRARIDRQDCAGNAPGVLSRRQKYIGAG